MTTRAPVEDALGMRLKAAREYRGLSQDEVARHIGVSRSAISLMESGTRRVSAAELSQLAGLYKATMESLTGDGPGDDETVSMVARAAADLSEKDRDEVLRFAEFLRARSVDEQT